MPAPLYTPWWRVRRQMGLSRSPISSMCWYSLHTLGSPHLMKNWKPSCPGHPISSKTIKFQIPMHTQSAISTNERQASNTRPAVLGATGRLLSAYMSISFMPVGLQKAALSNSPVDCCNQLGFLQKSESNRGLRIDALFILRYFLEKFVFKIEISFGCVSGKMMLQCHLGMNCGFLWYFCMCIFSHTELRGK